jgi:hypothetical protein
VDTALDLGAPTRRLPAAVSAEVDRRRNRIELAGRGQVLDLDGPQGRAVLADALVSGAAAPVAERYDTIISTGALTTWPDLRAALVAVDRLLADDGDLRLVEPVHHPGLWGLLAGSAGAWLPSARGRHLSRDVVATVRSVGMTIADVDRFTVDTWAWPLRWWIDARAVRIPRVGLEESVALA